MSKRKQRKRSLPTKYSDFVITSPISHPQPQAETPKKRKSQISFFSENSNKKSRAMEGISHKVKERSSIQKILTTLGLKEEMSTDTYISSPLDNPDWVTVRKVALLTSINGRGLFATRDIPKGTCVGLYTGEEYSPEGFEAYLQGNAEAHGNYAMVIGGKVIDASTKGNYTRYINFSDTQANVRFIARQSQHKKVVKVMTTADIKAGQQFLVDYNVYDENTSKHFYFLNPSDDWRSTEDLYSTYPYQTVKSPRNMPALNVKNGDSLLATPIGEAILENKLLSTMDTPYKPEEINLPYLKKQHRSLLSFEQTDVFTPLMLACYFGQFENVQWLINSGACINQQQHHSGNCPLFLALLGYSTHEDKSSFVKIINLLINNKANLLVHDRTDKTFLHRAISTLSKKDFKAVMDSIKGHEGVDFYELFSYIDENSDDILVFCLRQKLFDHAKILLRTYPAYFKEYYMSGTGEDKSFNRESFMNATKNYSSHEREMLFRLLKDQFKTAKPELFTELGLLCPIEEDIKNSLTPMMM